MQPLSALLPMMYAVFLWWFTTGLIIAAFGRAQWIMRLSFAGTTLAMLIALAGVVLTRNESTLVAVYVAVACGIIIWGWQVAGYYLNFITGVTDTSHQDGASLMERFWMALQASLHHELFAVAFGVLLAIMTWSAPNKFALWMYVALWAMHASAKLSVFFGVRNFRIEFLPQHMQHLGGLLNKRKSNGFLPFSVVVAISVIAVLLYQAIVPETQTAETAGYLMIVTMMALGVLEHLLLVLPVPAALWGWGIRELPEQNLQSMQENRMKG